MAARNLMIRRRVARARQRARARPKQIGPPRPDGPRCATCGAPLPRVPAFLASWRSPSGGFQCEKCFYPGTGRVPTRTAVVSSDRTRWLAEMISGSEQPAPARAQEEE